MNARGMEWGLDVRISRTLILGAILLLHVTTVDAQNPVTAQIRVLDLARGVAYEATVGENVNITCTFSTNPPTTNVAFVRFQRLLNVSYVNLFEYVHGVGVTANFGSYDGGSITGSLAANELSYTITLPNMTVADSGKYKCIMEDSAGTAPRDDPTVDITVVEPGPCAENPCVNGTCMENGAEYNCTCDAGFTGNTCATDISECTSDPCQNSGTCMEDVNGYTCACSECYSGAHCEAQIQNACDPDPCVNGGTCTDLCTNYTCDCPALFTGVNCETNIDECSSDPCLNGATCVDGINGYSCTCTDCYNGTHCDNEIQNPCDPDPCMSGGTCVNQCTDYMCECVAGYTGMDCETNVDECSSDPCLNGATCRDGINAYACVCTGCFNGTDCGNEIVDSCAVNPCENGGTCQKDCLAFICACPSGWRADTCTVEACTVDTCIHGNCSESVAGVECTCFEGYTGLSCETEIGACFSDPCMNGGTCLEAGDNFTCSCLSCFSGPQCENEILDPCADSPCLNGGSCVKDCTNYTCDCAIGYSGATNCSERCDNIHSRTTTSRFLLGSRAILTCVSRTNPATIYWSRDSTGSPRIETARDLVINSIGPTDEGTYYCFVAANGCIERATLSTTVHWDVDPSDTVFQNVTWEEGETGTLGCSVTTDPESDLKWQFTPTREFVESGNTTVEIPAETRDLNATESNSSLILTVENVQSTDAGRYACVASLPRSVKVLVKEVTVAVEIEEKDKNGLPWWAILLIVLLVLVVVGVVTFLIVYFCCLKTGKVGIICGGDNKYSAGRGGIMESKMEDNYSKNKRGDTTDRSDRSGRHSQRSKSSPSRSRSRSRYDDDEEDAHTETRRPLPHMSDKGRAQTLQPLDMETERKKMQKKKKKKKKLPVHQEDDETGEAAQERTQRRRSASYYDQEEEEGTGGAYGSSYQYRSY